MSASLPSPWSGVKNNLDPCCSKVIMSGGISNVIMSGCGDDNPDDERREAARGVNREQSPFSS